MQLDDYIMNISNGTPIYETQGVANEYSSRTHVVLLL